ncbi:hypothetical protein [Aureimonas pseudogalii]|uniref:Uncharacterized protein n=1 Tax=Aureimonas pseudogalii TaxID=1744844 RepID=A0A7W6H956_9HYPH|nr:hypothetical protein [Aureimonas pseudogalii]MBB4000929.1 hypothetical protein [Aureimonas pseudogalii]
MAVFTSIEQFLAANPTQLSNTKNETYNKLFRFFCSGFNFGGNEFACWASIQQFKKNPSKRLSIFITDTWLADEEMAPADTTDLSILSTINRGSQGSSFSVDSRKKLFEKTDQLKSVKTWHGKISNYKTWRTLASLETKMFDGLEGAVRENMIEIFKNGAFDTGTVIQANSHYAVSLRKDIPKLQAVTLPTNAMGLW